MNILTQEQLLLNAQAQFDVLKRRILEYTEEQIRTDQAERHVFAELLPIGLMLLRAFVAGAGVGDEGEQVLAKSLSPHLNPLPQGERKLQT